MMEKKISFYLAWSCILVILLQTVFAGCIELPRHTKDESNEWDIDVTTGLIYSEINNINWTLKRNVIEEKTDFYTYNVTIHEYNIDGNNRTYVGYYFGHPSQISGGIEFNDTTEDAYLDIYAIQIPGEDEKEIKNYIVSTVNPIIEICNLTVDWNNQNKTDWDIRGYSGD